MNDASLAIDQVHQGDCLELLARVPAGSVHLAFADPPFNIGYDYDNYDDSRPANDYLEWSKKWMSEVVRVLRPDGALWLAIGDEYAAELKVMATRELGLTCRSWVVWYYTFGVNCKNKFSRSHAHIFHFVRDSKKYTFNADAIRVPSDLSMVISGPIRRAVCPMTHGFYVRKICRRAFLPMRIHGISRGSAAHLRSGRAGTVARCQSSCLAESSALQAIQTRLCWIPLGAAAQRWQWLRSWAANTWVASFLEPTPPASASDWRGRNRAIPSTVPQSRSRVLPPPKPAGVWKTVRKHSSPISGQSNGLPPGIFLLS